MPFVIRKTTAREDAHKLTLPYNADGLPIDPNSPETAKTAGEILVYLRPLSGRDMRRISDLMIEMDRKGRGIMKSGSVAREKVIRSVVHLEGVVTADGTPVENLDHDLYDTLDAWITEAILAKVNNLNNLREEEEDL